MDRLVPPVVAWSPTRQDMWAGNALLSHTKRQISIGYFPSNSPDLQWIAEYLKRCILSSHMLTRDLQSRQEAYKKSSQLHFYEFNSKDKQALYTMIAPVTQVDGLEVVSHGLTDSSQAINVDILLVMEQCALEGVCFPSQVILDECYRLDSNMHRIDIRAATTAGMMNGVNTLRQLMDASDSHGSLPCGRIIDGPRFKWRGCLADVSRHFMDLKFVLRLIEILSYHKMNILHWHLVDDQGWRIEIKKYPLLTERGAWRRSSASDGSLCGGFYTQDEIRTVVEYGKRMNVEIVPEIELPGHCMAALASYPFLGCTQKQHEVPNEWGIYHDVYCAGRESTFEFLENVLKEVCDLFPSEYIHIGGDEVPKIRWNRCQHCNARMKAEGLKSEEELQSWFIRRSAKILERFGRRLIGWDEILEGGLEPTATVQAWRGYHGAYEAAIRGQHAIVSPTSNCYFDYPLVTTDIRKVYQFDPIPQGLNQEQQRQILGGECCMWTERAPQHLVLSKLFPRLLALATVLWSPKAIKENLSFEAFHCLLTEVHIPMRLEKLEIKCDDGLVKPPTTVLPCTISTTMGVHEYYFPEYAFDSDPASFYWSSRPPSEGDTFSIRLSEPLKNRADGHPLTMRVLTGKVQDPLQDRLRNGLIEVQMDGENEWNFAGEIINGVGEGSWTRPGLVRSFRVKVTHPQEQWLVIREIELSF